MCCVLQYPQNHYVVAQLDHMKDAAQVQEKTCSALNAKQSSCCDICLCTGHQVHSYLCILQAWPEGELSIICSSRTNALLRRPTPCTCLQVDQFVAYEAQQLDDHVWLHSDEKS